MEGDSYEVLGLDQTASLDAVKCAYRTLVKRYHPDRSDDPDAKAIFQRLNKAYRALMKQLCSDNDNPLSHDNESDIPPLPYVSFTIRENNESVTIDIMDMLILVILEECEKHHGVTPIDRGHCGLQFRFLYTSPNDEEQYGSLSLTFYATTSRLLVQGTSYLLWVEEHLPIIFNEAESRYTTDFGHWRTLALRRGIGLRRDSCQRRDRRAQLPSDTHATEPSVSSKPIDGSLLDTEHLALQPADSLDTGDRVMTSSLPLSDSGAQASECSVGLGLKTSVVDSASDGFSGYQTTSVLNDPLGPSPQHGSIAAPSIEDCCATSVTKDCISTPSPKGCNGTLSAGGCSGISSADKCSPSPSATPLRGKRGKGERARNPEIKTTKRRHARVNQSPRVRLVTHYRQDIVMQIVF